MSKISRPSFDPIKRKVRQRCGFGCVVCGLPLYQYEHMEGYAKVHRHVEKEITLLCDQHHREKTGGLLTLEQVRNADQDPINKKRGVSRPYDLHFEGKSCEMVMGRNMFTRDTLQDDPTQLIGIAIDRTPLLAFTFDQGHLFLTLLVNDDSGNPVLLIEQNELIYSTSPWDIELVATNLVIREKARKFLLDIMFELPNRIIIQRGRFSLNGIEFLIDAHQLYHANAHQGIGNVMVRNFDVALMAGEPFDDGRTCAINVGSLGRGEIDREEVEKWMREYAHDASGGSRKLANPNP